MRTWCVNMFHLLKLHVVSSNGSVKVCECVQYVYKHILFKENYMFYWLRCLCLKIIKYTTHMNIKIHIVHFSVIKHFFVGFFNSHTRIIWTILFPVLFPVTILCSSIDIFKKSINVFFIHLKLHLLNYWVRSPSLTTTSENN